MLDTISFRVDAFLRREFSDFDRPPAGWKVIRRGLYYKNAFALVHDTFGIRISGRDRVVTGVRVSLPRLLWSHNGLLITNKETFDLSFAWLEWILDKIMKPRSSSLGLIPGIPCMSPERYFTRIDLCWHFPNRQGVRAMLRNARHPRIRPLPSIYRGETVTHEGSLLKIMAYDKIAEMKRRLETPACNEGVDRLELSIKSKAIEKYYRERGGRGYMSLDYEWGRQLFRMITQDMDGMVIDTDGLDTSVYSYLAETEQLFPAEGHMERYIRRTSGSPEAGAKVRAKVRAARAKCRVLFSLADLFPADKPWHTPPVIDLPELQARHSAWLQEHARLLQALIQ
ncbi:MAG: hypothetical protein RL088_211 [Verrucomicrobiota bacterium]|jgi:hypothetical protein